MRYIDTEFFKKVVAKLVALYGNNFIFAPFSLNEPLLHKNIHELLAIANDYGLRTFLSSNLNVNCDFDALFASPALHKLIVSTSGMTQDIYGINHRCGNVSLFLKNLEKIASCKRHDHCKIILAFHQYTYNGKDEEQYEELCRQYGIEFAPYPGFFAPNDFLIPDCEEKKRALGVDDLTTQRHVGYLLSKQVTEHTPSARFSHIPCSMYDEGLFLSFDGQVEVCCLTVGMAEPCGSILDMDAEAIAAARSAAPICKQCKAASFHIYKQMRLNTAKSISGVMNRGRGDYLDRIMTKTTCFLDSNEYDAPELRGKGLYLYGATAAATLLQRILEVKGYTVKGYIDDSPKLQGRMVEGKQVRSLSDASALFSPDDLVVSCILTLSENGTERLKQGSLAGGAGAFATLHEFMDTYVTCAPGAQSANIRVAV